MNVVALTGGIGCGKSEATRMFSELGVPVTDLDIIAHQLTAANAPMVSQIASIFGNDYVTNDGAMHRGNMRELVFNDATARAKLNAILHPAIYQNAVAQLQTHQNASYQVLAIPLWNESSRYHPLVQHVLLIDCDEEIQIQRVMKRSQLTQAQVKKIIHAQTPRAERINTADTVINNDGNVTNLTQKIMEFHKNYINTCIVSK